METQIGSINGNDLEIREIVNSNKLVKTERVIIEDILKILMGCDSNSFSYNLEQHKFTFNEEKTLKVRLYFVEFMNFENRFLIYLLLF
jgi:hypothetical protein